MLEIESLGVRRGPRAVLEGVSIRAERGGITAIVGPNGAGKTTLLEAIAGLRPATGLVRWGGAALEGFAARARVFAYMPDEAALAEEASVETILRAASHDADRRAEIARLFGVSELLHRGARALSRGEQKRVWLARTALAARPALVLDEPLGAFDPLQLDALVPALRTALGDEGLALVTVHQMSVAERVADRIVMLAGGRLVAEGSLAELRERTGATSLEEVFRALLEEKDDRVAV